MCQIHIRCMEILKKTWREKRGRWFCKTDEGWMQLARAVWIIANGPIPPGYEIHHVDKDSTNDSLDNLEVLTHAEHLRRHCVGRVESEETRTKKRLANLGKIRSEETRQLLRDRWKQRKARNSL